MPDGDIYNEFWENTLPGLLYNTVKLCGEILERRGHLALLNWPRYGENKGMYRVITNVILVLHK